MQGMKGFVCAALAACAGVASATTYEWTYNGPWGNQAGGALKSVSASFNSNSNVFEFVTVFDDQVADGYTVAFSPGANPKGHSAELALLYFDANDFNDVHVTAYAYNGVNSASSYFDGSPAGGTQAPDKIVESFINPISWILSATAQDIGTDREFRLRLNASAIQNHIPIYAPSGEWTGLAFGEQLGVWLHPYKNLVATYGQDGFLTNWRGNEGWLDLNDQNTTPAPGAMAALGLAALGARRRRR